MKNRQIDRHLKIYRYLDKGRQTDSAKDVDVDVLIDNAYIYR